MGDDQDRADIRNFLKQRICGNAYRYSPGVIEQTLKSAIQAWKGKITKSPLTQLQEAVDRLPTVEYKKIMD
jgi:hypothetical protein